MAVGQTVPLSAGDLDQAASVSRQTRLLARQKTRMRQEIHIRRGNRCGIGTRGHWLYDGFTMDEHKIGSGQARTPGQHGDIFRSHMRQLNTDQQLQPQMLTLVLAQAAESSDQVFQVARIGVIGDRQSTVPKHNGTPYQL